MRKDIFDVFASSVRLQLLCCLAKGRRNVQDLISNCGLSQSAVSQHLEKLRSVGLIVGEKEGKYVYYSLVYPQSADLAQKIKVFIEEVSLEESTK